MLCVPLQFLNTLKILSAPLTSSHSIFFLSINAYMAKKKMLMKMLIVVALNRLMKSFKWKGHENQFSNSTKKENICEGRRNFLDKKNTHTHIIFKWKWKMIYTYFNRKPIKQWNEKEERWKKLYLEKINDDDPLICA